MTLWNLCADKQKEKDSRVTRGVDYREVRGGGV